MATSEFYIQDNSNIEDKKLEAAKGLYRAGNYSGALKLYLDMVNTSYSYKLYYEIGRCYYKMNDAENAEKYFLQSVNLEKYKNPSYIFLGNLLYKQKNIEKAIEYWMTAYAYKPDDEAVCLNLATSYFSKEMKFQSLYFYQKYLKYAKDKTTSYYEEISKSVNEFIKIGNEFYEKAQNAVFMKDYDTAIQALEYAARNLPIGFDINNLLGKLFFEKKDYKSSIIYLKQAHCIDSKSLDVLQKLSSALINTNDISGAYCCLKRIIPLVINNQKEYLTLIKMIKQFEENVKDVDIEIFKNNADKYYNDNQYHLALYEYENCIILKPELNSELSDKIDLLKTFINPEDRIVKSCFERGGASYSNGDYKQSNKYFSRIMTLSDENSSEYKLAKSRLVNV